MLEQDKQVVRHDANPKESGIGLELPAGHALHPKPDLQFLEVILGGLPSLAVPDQSGFPGFGTVAGNDVISWLIIE